MPAATDPTHDRAVERALHGPWPWMAVALVAGLAIFGWLAFGSVSDEGAATTTTTTTGVGEVSVDPGSGSYTYRDDAGATFESNVDGQSTALPDDWPEALALPPEATISSVATSEPDGVRTIFVLVDAPGSVEAWADQLRTLFADAGYELGIDATDGSGEAAYAGLSATGDWDVFASVDQALAGPGAVQISLTLSEPQG